MQRMQTVVRNNPLLSGIILATVVIAVGTNVLLHADLTGGGKDGGGTEAEQRRNLRACSSSGTVFAGLTPKEVTEKFRSDMSLVVQERQDLLIKPSLWTCATDDGAGTDPPMPQLTAMATNKMPAWTIRTGKNTYETKPVRFADFSTIVMEYERNYECTLSEFQGNALSVVSNDLDDYGLQNPQEKSISLLHIDSGLGARMNRFSQTMQNERRRARIAVERTVTTLRSMEIAAPLTTRMQCLVRQQLDLRSLMSLLADTMSCMPRIWDAATSLHDRSSSASTTNP